MIQNLTETIAAGWAGFRGKSADLCNCCAGGSKSWLNVIGNHWSGSTWCEIMELRLISPGINFHPVQRATWDEPDELVHLDAYASTIYRMVSHVSN